MRGFLVVSGLMAGGIAVAFILALLSAKDPVERRPSALIEGAEFRDAEAQEAFNSWMSGLPAEPSTPLRLRLELSGSAEFSMELRLADARRGRAEFKLRTQDPSLPAAQGEGVLIADGETIWLWGEMEGIGGSERRKQAFSIKQSLVEDAWSSLRPRYPELMKLAELESLSQAVDPPGSVLLLLHPAWLSRSLAALTCTSLRLEGSTLHGSFLTTADPSSPVLLASLDVRTGMPQELQIAGPIGATGAQSGLLLRIRALDSDLPDALLAPPEDLKPTDVSPMAQLAMGALNAALAALGGGAPTSF